MSRRMFFPAGIILVTLIFAVLSALSLYSQSIRLDESQSLWIATKSVPGVVQFTAENTGTPLYNLLLHFWVQVFGTTTLSTRSLSFLFFVLTLPAVYLFAREASDSRVGFLTVVLFALSPFVLWFSNETQMYTLFTLVTAVNHYYFLRLFNTEGKRGRLGFFLSSAAGFFTHYFFIFLVISQGIFLLIKFVSEFPRQGVFSFWSLRKYFQTDGRMVWSFIYLESAAFLVFLPWVFYVAGFGFTASLQPAVPRPTLLNILQTLFSFVFGFQNPALQALVLSLWPLLVIFLFFAFTSRRQIPLRAGTYFVLVTFLPILLVFAASYIGPIFLSRYLIFVIPTMFFLIAWTILNYSRRLSSAVIAGLLVVMVGLLIYQDASATTPVKENYRQVSTYLNTKVTPRDIVAVSAPFTVYPIEYYYLGPAKIVTIPYWNLSGSGPVPAFSLNGLTTQVAAYKAVYSRIFLVLSYDQGYQQTIQNYFDKNYQLLSVRNFRPGIEVRVYRLRYDIPLSVTAQGF